MASYKAFVISGFLLMTIIIVVQSIPVKQTKEIVKSSLINNKQAGKQHHFKSVNTKQTSSISTSSTTSPTTTVSQSSSSTPAITDNKKKRYIDDDQLDEFLDSESDETDINQLPYLKLDNSDDKIHAKIQETSAKIHDKADKPIDTDNSKVFSDIKMSPNELTDVIRQRRNIKLNDESNRRRKRALSPYDFYDADSFYDPYADLIEREQYVRPIRSFAPLYWYPSVYERNIRSALTPSFYESPSIDDDDDESDESPVSIFDDENSYESNRYPILLQSSNNPFDNLQLQQQYNTDDLPIDEDFEDNFNDDDDNDEVLYQTERPYNVRYGPIERYF